MQIDYRVLSIPVAVLITVALLWQTDLGSRPDTDIHLGTWTCESGLPGNRLSFWYVETEPHLPMVCAYNGRVKVEDFWELTSAEGEWNFGYWEPLVVNLSLDDRFGYAAFKRIGPNHLLVRYTEDYDQLLNAPFDHPDVLRLRRVHGEME